jgi:hypothetical protein
MSFLNGKPDLTGTIFTDNDLYVARQYLLSVISQEDPRWLKKPIGIIGMHWESDGQPSACFLINIAQMLYVIDHGIATKSIPRLQKKFRDLLRSPDEQFEENYNELQVGSVVVQNIKDMSGLAFLEKEDILHPKVTRCPDFAFQSSDGVVFLEATVFHGGIIDIWTKTVDSIRSALEKYVLEHAYMLDIDISLPLQAEMETKQIIDLTLQELGKVPIGEVRIGSKGVIRWKPPSIITVQDSLAPFDRQQNFPEQDGTWTGIIRSSGAVVDRAFISRSNINLASEEDLKQARELLLKSFRQKLREKRGQFPKNEPEVSLIVLRIDHSNVIESEIASLLRQRIWPNEKEYDWLSGLVIFTPRSNFSPSDIGDRMILYPNPRTYRPITPSVIALFDNTLQQRNSNE